MYTAVMKKRRLTQSFTPDAIASKLSERKLAQEELDAVFSRLKRFDISELLQKNIIVNEEQALQLLSAKLGISGLLALKLALDHVPRVYSAKTRGTSISIRDSLVAEIMNRKGFSASPSEVTSYVEVLERFCRNFLTTALELGDILWELSGESAYRFNKFISPPVELCLKCDKTLVMHNQPSKAVVHGATGPLPATKVTLQCKTCKTSYGISHFTDESGRHLYPKEIESPLIEASNVAYMERNFYKWIPSLG